MSWLKDLRRKAETLRHRLPLYSKQRRVKSAGASNIYASAAAEDDAQVPLDFNIGSRDRKTLPNSTACPQCSYQPGVISAMKAIRPIADPNSNSFSCEGCGRSSGC